MIRGLKALKTKYFKELIKSSGIVFFSSVIANVCNLLFVLFMVRKLNVIDYGILNSLFSLLMILSLPTGTLQTLVTKFVAQFKSQGRINHIYYFLKYLGKRILLGSIVSLICFIVLSPQIASFLKIEQNYLIIMLGVILFFSFLIPLLTGTILGLQHYVALSLYGVAISGLKLILSIILVSLGFKVFGALGGMLLSIVIGFIIAIFLVPKKIFHYKAEKFSKMEFISVYKFILPASISYFCLMILTNSDIVLVKHFFDPLSAGNYSVAQIIGKIIIFIPAAIVIVLFPKMVGAYHSKQNVNRLLKIGLVLTGILSGSVSIFCLLFPVFTLKILTGKDCIECVRYVPFFCFAMFFYALVNMLYTYFLAVQKYRLILFLILGCFLQIGLITLFHQNLIQVLYILVVNSIGLFVLGIINVKSEETQLVCQKEGPVL